MTAIASFALLFGAVAVFVPEPAEAATTGRMNFGMDAASIDRQTNAGVKPDYGTIWVGPWNLKHGWSGTDAQLKSMANDGVVPAIHFYYWGDDISKSCIEYGCWSSLHGAHKSKSGWDTLAKQLSSHLHSTMGGSQVVIFLETEFNKGDVQTYEPLDYYLKQKADYFHSAYPNSKVVLALGNWNSGAWGTWNRAAGASDFVGLQGMRGSTHETYNQYMTLYESTIAGAKKAQSLFGKPIIIQDIALSTHPEPSYVQPQADALKKFFTNLGTLKAAGVKGIIYRSWNDNPNFDTNNYYGEAERHWGLAYSWNTFKPSAKVWIAGVKAERSGNTPSSSSSSIQFSPTSVGNEWWVETKVQYSTGISKVYARSDSGSWNLLGKTSYGTWAKSFHVAKGSSVTFWAVDAYGKNHYSQPYAWGGTPTTSTFSATFAPKSVGNEWWVDVDVSSSKSVSKVNARVDSGSWVSLPKTSWGTWAKSIHVPKGSTVTFQAIDGSGNKATSSAYQWGNAFAASFSPKSTGNDWWIDVGVTSKSTVSKVEVRVNGGSWTTLPKTDWGTWAKSVHAPNGSSVVFRATDNTGASVTSSTYKW